MVIISLALHHMYNSWRYYRTYLIIIYCTLIDHDLVVAEDDPILKFARLHILLASTITETIKMHKHSY